MPKISVIMPVYNTKEEYLRGSIESILNQTYTDFEFIIINDGSTNNAESVILSYKDQRIRYIKQENLGVPKSLNKGFNIANGEYIARMDADDISLPARFEKQVDFLDKNKNISIVGTLFKTFPTIKTVLLPQHPKILDFLKFCCIGHPTVMLRKLDFDKYALRYNEEFKVAQDYELWSRAVRVLNFANIQEVLFMYRVHENNNSRSSDRLKRNDKFVKNSILNFLTQNIDLQNDIKKTIVLNYYPFSKKVFKEIFSISNEYFEDYKYKIMTILSLKFVIKKEKI